VRPEAPHTSRSSYFRQAARLRWCLQQNLGDHLHVESGGRIVYVMDTNVVRFFIHPERDRRLVRVFAPGESSEVDTGTALVTAEYLFSRQLPGQHAMPAFISPDHGDEIQEIITALADDLPSPGAVAPATRELERLVNDVRAGNLVRKDAIIALREMVPDLAHHLLDGCFQETAQLHRLYHSDLLRPLGLHPAATRKIFALDSENLRLKA
jgi:hypothetical protein